MTLVTKKPRGFAALTPERRRELASLGGKSVKPENRTFADVGRARAAGQNGGKAVRASDRTFSRDPEKARAAGRIGGLARKSRVAVEAGAASAVNFDVV